MVKIWKGHTEMRKRLMARDFPGPPEVAVVTEKLLDGVWGELVSAWLWADDWPSANIHFCHTTNSTGLSNHNSPELSCGNLREQMPSCLKTTVTRPRREHVGCRLHRTVHITHALTHTGTCRCRLSSNLHFFFWCKQHQSSLALIIIGFLKPLCSTLFILCFYQNRNSIRDWGSNSKIRIFVRILRLNSFSICTIGKKEKKRNSPHRNTESSRFVLASVFFLCPSSIHALSLPTVSAMCHCSNLSLHLERLSGCTQNLMSLKWLKGLAGPQTPQPSITEWT